MKAPYVDIRVNKKESKIINYLKNENPFSKSKGNIIINNVQVP